MPRGPDACCTRLLGLQARRPGSSALRDAWRRGDCLRRRPVRNTAPRPLKTEGPDATESSPVFDGIGGPSVAGSVRDARPLLSLAAVGQRSVRGGFTAEPMMIKVLFVCMGNICRSPMGQGVFQRLVCDAALEDRIEVDSAGTHAYHVGEAPDPRARKAAGRRGYELGEFRARKATAQDVVEYDYIIAMDYDNLAHLKEMALPEHEEKLFLFMDFAPDRKEREVPDPYYGSHTGFERVLDLVEEACEGLLHEVRRREGI